ncbi:hypothetical protein GHYDROH2_27440 [Geobacter hydrogenophilus]|uniref:Uncharacterized protein n=1 Tax=Geobacter hydrogenophilus TaxID=40983 RepID=A0A9W6G2M9_9BACT|nr:hypothetical protein GHYDROH2_27440 [Geobacter hydrogenophilus]
MLVRPPEIIVVNDQNSAVWNWKCLENTENRYVTIGAEICPIMGTQQGVCAIFNEKYTVVITNRLNLFRVLGKTEIMSHKECRDVPLYFLAQIGERNLQLFVYLVKFRP